MDTQALKARAIELAERAYRQKDRATDERVQEALDATAAELLRIDDIQRFFKAQSKLEKHSLWTEEQRALAHEMSAADLTIKNVQTFDIDVAVLFLKRWANSYLASTNDEARQVGEGINAALEKLMALETLAVKQESFNYIISFLEAVLEHAANNEATVSTETIVLLRNMRDSLLSARELLYDEDDLLEKVQDPNSEIVRLRLARESVEAIIAGIKPVQVPR